MDWRLSWREGASGIDFQELSHGPSFSRIPGWLRDEQRHLSGPLTVRSAA